MDESHHLGVNTSINQYNDVHQKLFSHYFEELFLVSAKLDELSSNLQEECNKQYPGEAITVDIKRSGESKIVVFEFRRTPQPITPPQSPVFHMSIHKIGQGRTGRLGLIHVIKERDLSHEQSIERQERQTDFLKRIRWKNEVLMDIKVKQYQKGQTNFLRLSANSTHQPRQYTAASSSGAASASSGAASAAGGAASASGARNALVNRPTHSRIGGPTLLMRYGVTISRVLREYMESVPPMRL